MKAKPIIYLLTLIIITLLVTDCSKDESFYIEYPDSGFFGKNILNINDTIFKYDDLNYGDGYYYSMKAILPSMDNKIKIEITGTRIAAYNSQGWLYEPFNEEFDNYIFYSEGCISSDARIHFCSESEKRVTINIYENDDVIPTRIKSIVIKN